MAKMPFSLTKLISNLLAQTDDEEFAVDPSEDIKQTTVRLEPQVRVFCERQAEKLGISIQSFIAMVLKGMMYETMNPVKSELILICERFFHVFKVHNIPTADIPTLLKEHQFRMSSLSDQGRLLDALTPAVTETVAKLFAVQPDWLRGIAHKQAQQRLHWGLSLGAACSKIMELYLQKHEISLLIVKDESFSLDDIQEPISGNDFLTMVLRVGAQYGDNKHYYFYQPLEGGRWGDERSRHRIKALILFCFLLKILPYGYELPSKPLNEVSSAELFVEKWNVFCQDDWHPLEYVEFPENTHTSNNHCNELNKVITEFYYGGLDKIFKDAVTGEKISFFDLHPFFNTIQEMAAELSKTYTYHFQNFQIIAPISSQTKEVSHA